MKTSAVTIRDIKWFIAGAGSGWSSAMLNWIPFVVGMLVFVALTIVEARVRVSSR